MVNCQNCGEEVVEGAKFCKNCGSEIVVEQANEKDTKFCSNCGFEMPKASKFCPECGTTAERVPPVMNTTTIVVPSNKSSGLAALLSFLIIGLGQVYLGLTKKGIILFLLAIISGVLMMVLIGWITWLLVWGYAIYDAYNSCEKMKKGIEVEDTLDFNNLF
ncbi:double zinc ribbon domain-containing protein [Methanobrevibacter sp. UBA212]|jgi:TM2 domain-containing membrane protein YozV|uniref:double zinc ribbon domain-containing protein n=1 Tax=Methanobrevibacter sp. UBA212 TaxID=1915476 RepID=UPI0025F25864|nr:zinc ribbon domain-containing protein [Methanobrevibacter sp. UBA212]